MRRLAGVLFVLALLALPRGAAAAQTILVEAVTANVHDNEVELRVRSTMREPVVATDAKPAMPPLFSRAELEGVAERWGAYFVAHAHLVARAKPLEGKVTSAKLVDGVDEPIKLAELERAHAEVVVVYALTTADPITISFDVLGDREVEPGVPWPIAYALDVHGPRAKHADLATNATFTFDVVQASSVGGTGPRADATTGKRRTNPGASALVGAVIFGGILYFAYSIIQKRRRR